MHAATESTASPPTGGVTPAGGPSADVFQWPIRVYWEDTDAGGIVFYANYLKFFERARTEWLRQLGIGQHDLRQRHGGFFVVTETTLSYRHSARLDDQLSVTARLTHAGRASVALQQQAWRQAPGERVLLCEGSIRIGWVDAQSLRATRMPGELSGTLTAALGSTAGSSLLTRPS